MNKNILTILLKLDHNDMLAAAGISLSAVAAWLEVMEGVGKAVAIIGGIVMTCLGVYHKYLQVKKARKEAKQ